MDCDTWAHKVTQVISPSQGVAGVLSPNPPIAGPSMVTWLPLFEELVQSGGEKVGLWLWCPQVSGDSFVYAGIPLSLALQHLGPNPP